MKDKTKMLNRLSFVIFVLTGVLLLISSGHAQYSPELEAALLEELYDSNYSTSVRPTSTVLVRTSFVLYTINDLSIVDQTLSVSGLLSMKWMDKRLSWATDSDYSAVLFLFSTEEDTWTPAVYVENSVEDLSILNDEYMPLRIQPNGEVLLVTSGVFKVSCECDVTYYPMDRQICYIKITTGGYSQGEIDLRFDTEPFDLSEYLKNGEWEILSASGSSSDGLIRSRGGIDYSRLKFKLQLKRRHLFHIINTIFPVFLLGILVPFVFHLNEVGDRIGYSLTVLLSFAVYLTLIAENIPSTSVSVCYLSVYLATILTLSTLSILIVIWLAKMASSEEEMSSCSRSLALCFAKISCCNRRSCCCRKRKADSKARKGEVYENGAGFVFYKYDRRPHNENAPEYDNDDAITWQDFASHLDHCCFVIFFFIIILASLVLFIIWGIEYVKFSS